MKKLLAILLFVTSSAAAQPPLPEDQWTDEAKLWLARAFVAEAGWSHELDHVYIAWALTYRWRQRRLREPEVTFADVVKRYCSAFGNEDTITRRQTWVRNLPELGLDTMPFMWPSMYSWGRHLKYWRNVQAFTERWGAGLVRDPSRGRVRHWGSASPELPDITIAQRAINLGKWVELVTPGTQNRFYAYPAGGQ